jgi:hypothetical protein
MLELIGLSFLKTKLAFQRFTILDFSFLVGALVVSFCTSTLLMKAEILNVLSCTVKWARLNIEVNETSVLHLSRL